MFIFRLRSPKRLLLNVVSICVLFGTFVAGCKHNEPLQRPKVAPPAAEAQKLIAPLSREAKITAAVERVIASPAPAGYAPIPAGTRLLALQMVGSKVILNFNKALLLNGAGAKLEDAIKQLTNPVSDILSDMADVEYQILIEGKRLGDFL